VKEELRESQAEHPPWGDFVCIDPEQGVRVFQTSGTTGIPVKAILNKKDWTVHYYEEFMHFMYGYGIKRSDILFVPFNFGLHIAWWGFSAALEQEGVMIVPGGNLRKTASGTFSSGSHRRVRHPTLCCTWEKLPSKLGYR
jgi:phenylacetate-CoA ligase